MGEKILEIKSTEEIAERICELAKNNNEEIKKEEFEEIEQCIYYIKTVAQNEYNKDYFRTFYNILQKI